MMAHNEDSQPARNGATARSRSNRRLAAVLALSLCGAALGAGGAQRDAPQDASWQETLAARVQQIADNDRHALVIGLETSRGNATRVKRLLTTIVDLRSLEAALGLHVVDVETVQALGRRLGAGRLSAVGEKALLVVADWWGAASAEDRTNAVTDKGYELRNAPPGFAGDLLSQFLALRRDPALNTWKTAGVLRIRFRPRLLLSSDDGRSISLPIELPKRRNEPKETPATTGTGGGPTGRKSPKPDRRQPRQATFTLTTTRLLNAGDLAREIEKQTGVTVQIDRRLKSRLIIATRLTSPLPTFLRAVAVALGGVARRYSGGDWFLALPLNVRELPVEKALSLARRAAEIASPWLTRVDPADPALLGFPPEAWKAVRAARFSELPAAVQDKVTRKAMIWLDDPGRLARLYLAPGLRLALTHAARYKAITDFYALAARGEHPSPAMAARFRANSGPVTVVLDVP